MSLSTLIQEMDWCQIGANPFLESMLILDRRQLKEQTSVKYFSKFTDFSVKMHELKKIFD